MPEGRNAAFSPDGMRIAFEAEREGRLTGCDAGDPDWCVYVMDVAAATVKSYALSD